MSFLSWIQQNVNAIQSAATSGSTTSSSWSKSEMAKNVQRRLTMANRATGSLNDEPTGSGGYQLIRPRTRSKSDGSPSPPVLLPVKRQNSKSYNNRGSYWLSSPTLTPKRGGGHRVKPTLQHAATADLINRVQEADGGFFESFSALSWKRENRRLQVAREEEVKRESPPPNINLHQAGAQMPHPHHSQHHQHISKKEWQRLYVTVLYTISNQIGSRASDRSPYVDDLYRFAQMAFTVSDEDHQRSITLARNEQPPIIVLNVTVVEARGLEAKDPNGFSDPFCMLGIQPSTGSGNGQAYDNVEEPEEEDESRLKKHHSFKLSFKRKEAAKKQEVVQSPSRTGSGNDGFSNDIPAKYICATSVKPHTLNPQWEEKFTLDIDDVSTDRLHLDIWDNDDESSVLEAVRQLNQVQSWKGLGRYFKQIAQSARSHGSYSVDDFLGCVDVCLNDIPSKGLERWFPLEGRSQRSNVQGEIRLRLSLSTRDRVSCGGPEQWWAVREHEKMLLNFIEYEIIRQGDDAYRWRGKLPVEAEVILHQHAIQNDLTELQQAISRWRAFSQKHREKSFDYSVLHRLLQKLNQAWSNDHLTPEEEQTLTDSFTDFVEFSFSLLTKHREVFPPINKAAIYKLEFLLKCLGLMSDMQAFWRCCPFHKEIHLEIINCIKKGNIDWYDKLYSQSRPQLKNEDSNIRGLIELVNLINFDLQKCLKYYNKLYESIINVNYFLIVYKQLDKLVEEDVKGVVEKLCRRLRENDDVSSDDQSPASAENLNMGTAMFELYLSLQEFANFKEHLQPSDRRGLCCVGFHEWFSGALLKWLTIARLKAMLRIRKAVELDRAAQVDSSVKLSTSSVDTTACFYQIKDFWKQLAWSDMVTAYPFVFKILDDICNGATYYGQLIHQKLQEVGYFDDDGQFDVTEQLCLTINNMEHVKHSLKSIPEEMCILNILNVIDKAEGEAYGQQCRQAVNNIIKSAEEDVENKIIIVVQRVGHKMKADLKKSIFHLAWAPDALPADNAIVPLLEYLDNNLATLNHTLFRTNFERILQVIWILVLEEMKCQVESGVGEKQTIYFQRLSDACNILIEFFHAEQKGLDIEKLHCQTYQQLEDVLTLHKSETIELINKYFIEKIEQQRSLTKREFGSLTVKVYFHHDCLFIEILHARDVIALDPNGFSDPFVIIELAPPWLFPSSPQQRTKVQKKTLHPLFDECFEYAVTLEQCRREEAVVLFTVMDHDLMMSNDFAGEACLSLNSTAGVNSHLPASEIHRLPSTELILSRPKFTDCVILTTLDKRSWDKTAQDFAKKRKSLLL
ncbi:hypothetical protein CHUAL_012069 [Chamberlinius hualienensis]